MKYLKKKRNLAVIYFVLYYFSVSRDGKVVQHETVEKKVQETQKKGLSTELSSYER